MAKVVKTNEGVYLEVTLTPGMRLNNVLVEKDTLVHIYGYDKAVARVVIPGIRISIYLAWSSIFAYINLDIFAIEALESQDRTAFKGVY